MSDLDDFYEEIWRDVDASDLKPCEYYVARHPDDAIEVEREHRKIVELQARVLEFSRGGDNVVAEKNLVSGDHVDQYRIVRCIGRGGQGAVFEAVDRNLDRSVALKVLNERDWLSLEAHSRFRREARLASRLDHPGICPIFDFGFDICPYFVMPYLAGRSLAAELASRGASVDFHINIDSPDDERSSEDSVPAVRALTPDEIERYESIFERVAEALHHAHENGVLHRDISPGNIFIGEGDRPLIVDFGLARAIDRSHTKLTRTGTAMGTPCYMAPEAVRGEHDRVDARTDVYSLGATLYHALSGQPPFEGQSNHALFTSILTHTPTAPARLNDSIPLSLSKVVMKAIRKNPESRYQSARELGEDIARARARVPVLANKAVSVHNPSSGSYVRRREVGRRRKKRLVIDSAAGTVRLFVLLGAAGSAFVTYCASNGESEQPQGKQPPSTLSLFESSGPERLRERLWITLTKTGSLDSLESVTIEIDRILADPVAELSSSDAAPLIRARDCFRRFQELEFSPERFDEWPHELEKKTREAVDECESRFLPQGRLPTEKGVMIVTRPLGFLYEARSACLGSNTRFLQGEFERRALSNSTVARAFRRLVIQSEALAQGPDDFGLLLNGAEFGKAPRPDMRPAVALLQHWVRTGCLRATTIESLVDHLTAMVGIVRENRHDALSRVIGDELGRLDAETEFANRLVPLLVAHIGDEPLSWRNASERLEAGGWNMAPLIPKSIARAYAVVITSPTLKEKCRALEPRTLDGIHDQVFEEQFRIDRILLNSIPRPWADR